MSPLLYQYRLPPVPVLGEVAVDGSDPDALGVAWLPRTAVGEGDEPGGKDEAEVATELAVAADRVGDPDCAAEGDAEAETALLVAVGGALSPAPADGFAELGDELGLACVAEGRRAIDPVDDAAKTAAPSATRPRIATIGTSPIRRPRGRRVRQLGQKPETGVVM